MDTLMLRGKVRRKIKDHIIADSQIVGQTNIFNQKKKRKKTLIYTGSKKCCTQQHFFNQLATALQQPLFIYYLYRIRCSIHRCYCMYRK
jgi:hypothetical protein